MPSKKIVIPDLLGGLGNQLFLVAAGLRYAKINNMQLCLQKGITSIRSWGKARSTYTRSVFKKIPCVKKVNFQKVIEKNQDKPPPGDRVFLTGGYYQDYSRLLDTRESLIATLCLPDIPIKAPEELAVHIRLGDASTPLAYAVQATELDKIKNFINSELASGVLITVFSNDIPEAKKLVGSRCNFSQSNDEVQDLMQLASYSRILVSASTFVTWSLFLTQFPKHAYIPFDSSYGGNRNLSHRHIEEIPWVQKHVLKS